MRLRLFVSYVRIVKFEDQITFKRGATEWEASYSISSLVPSADTRNNTTVTEAMRGRKEFINASHRYAAISKSTPTSQFHRIAAERRVLL